MKLVLQHNLLQLSALQKYYTTTSSHLARLLSLYLWMMLLVLQLNWTMPTALLIYREKKALSLYLFDFSTLFPQEEIQKSYCEEWLTTALTITCASALPQWN